MRKSHIERILMEMVASDFNWAAPVHLDITYPPTNLCKLDEKNYLYETAVAGFAKDELQVELDRDERTGEKILTIKGQKKPEQEDKSKQYLYRGLAYRSFKRQWILAEHMEIKHVELSNGVLSIALQLNEPERKVQTLEIKTS